MSRDWDGIWDDWHRDEPTPRHGRTTRRRVSKANPRSTNPTDPYVNLVEEGLPTFRVVDPMSTVFGYEETFEIEEISNTGGTLQGFGRRVLRNNSLAARQDSNALPLRWEDVPTDLHERLRA